MKKHFLLALVLSLSLPDASGAFCGFYVAKADTKLFNKSSQVVLVRDEDKTVLTMANDYQGEPKEFALVIPVPTFIEKEQIHIANKALIDHLDAYSAPRLVEYFDSNPCIVYKDFERGVMMAPMAEEGKGEKRAKSLGVTIEARYTVGEYDILILSAKESGGLETWLVENGYKIPQGATSVLGSYIKQKMRFFVAKVNLKEQSKLGFSYLRPIQVAFNSPKFMLPIRLGTVNADGPQDLFIYTLTRKGRVETTNYRTVKLPSDANVPLYTKDVFADFYKALFSAQVKKEDMRVVFMEYAWDMNWCDPCAADPLSKEELKELGVFWTADDEGKERRPPMPWSGGGGGVEVYLTRLHTRYDAAHFPEDLVFQQTADRDNFQGRYVMNHPWKGEDDCQAAKDYHRNLPKRWEEEATTLAKLTGWDINEIRKKMKLDQIPPKDKQDDSKWWKKIWGLLR